MSSSTMNSEVNLQELLIPGRQVEIIDPAPRAPILTRPHPAAFPDPILAEIRNVLPPGKILDPFGGIGRLGQIETWGPVMEMFSPEQRKWHVVAVDIEPEWICQAIGNGCVAAVCADSRALPFPDETFDGAATSPPYGNRLADKYVPPDIDDPKEATRRSYRIFLGRPLSSGNAAAAEWGPEYRALCEAVWKETRRVLKPGATLVVNVKDFPKDGQVVCVVDWHRDCLLALGFTLVDRLQIPLKGDQNTARARTNGQQTVDHEEILVLAKP